MSLLSQVLLLSCMDFDTNNPSLNFQKFDPFFDEGSVKNPFSGTLNWGFDPSETYTNGVSTDLRAYPSTPLVPNGVNSVLHGSEPIGETSNGRFDPFEAYANGVSTDLKAYPSTPLVPNGINSMLHGSGTIGGTMNRGFDLSMVYANKVSTDLRAYPSTPLVPNGVNSVLHGSGTIEGTLNEGFDSSEIYANRVSTDLRAYPSILLVPNGANSVLHGSGTIGGTLNEGFDPFEVYANRVSADLRAYPSTPLVPNGAHSVLHGSGTIGGTLNEGFDSSEVYANRVSTDLRAYPSIPSVPNGVKSVLHGSGTIGFWDYTQIGVQTIFEASVYQPTSCQDQYRSARTPASDELLYTIKGQWTPQEDKLLMSLVKPEGPNKWSIIAKMINGRLGKQCRERWYNHLQPDIKKSAWSEDEDIILIKEHIRVGNHWAKIASSLPGRTENNVKNHWNATKRRHPVSHRKSNHSIRRNAILQEYVRFVENQSTTPPSTNEPDNHAQEPPSLNTQAPEESSNDSIMGDGHVPNSDHISNGVSFDTNILYDGFNFGQSMLDEIPYCSFVDEGNFDLFKISSELDGSFME